MARVKQEPALLRSLRENPEDLLVTILGTLKEMCDAAFEGTYQFISLSIATVIELLESDRVSKIAEQKGLDGLKCKIIRDLEKIEAEGAGMD